MIAEVRDRIGSELERLSRQLTDELGAGLGGATTVCAAPEERREVQQRIRRLGQLVAGLVGLEHEALPVDRVGYGSSVVLQDLETRQRISYTLVTGDVIDLDEDQVSLASPVGQALLGRKTGDRVSVETPAGTARYRIVSMATLPQMLERCRRAPDARADPNAGRGAGGHHRRGMTTRPIPPVPGTRKRQSAATETVAALRHSSRAGDRARTGDIQLGRLTLYQLSYSRKPADQPSARAVKIRKTRQSRNPRRAGSPLPRATCRNRTDDLRITSAVLYQLS